jgi:type IV pilus assembly protein PilA
MNKETHMILKLRERMASREEGFTLIELLVVMLIIGILAAIAIPTFFNQTNKAKDSSAKSMAHTAQTAMESLGVDNNGDYTTASPANLKVVEKSVATAAPAPFVSTATGTTTGWTIVVTSKTGNTFSIVKDATTGTLTYTCTVPAGNDRGGCPSGGNWG